MRVQGKGVSTGDLEPEPRKILVVDLGFLGDTVHLIPALRELSRHHPAAEIHVVTTPVGAEVLRLAPWLGHVWVYPLGRPSPPWWRHLGFQWRLARERFDLSFNFSGADRTLWVNAFAGVRHRWTRQGLRGGVLRNWLAGRWLPAPSRSLPVFEQRRQCLAAAGYSLAPPRFDLEIPEEAAAWAETRIPSGAVHLSVNASSAFKEWPIARWAELTRLLRERGVETVIATATPARREQVRLAELASAVADDRLILLSEGLSVPRLAAVLSRCRAHVGTDSGVTHLAMALNLPTISVFREYRGLEEWRPSGPVHSSASAPCHCADAAGPTPDCLAAGTALCLGKIQASTVADLVMTRLLPGLPSNADGTAV